MADLPVSLVVSAGSGGIALTISTANGYRVSQTGLSSGLGAMRRQTAQSPWVRGRSLVHAVEDVVVSIIEIRIQGTSWADHAAKMLALTRALRQTSYTLTNTIQTGASEVWTNCEPADISYGSTDSSIDPFAVRAFQQLARFSIPHDPVTM